MNTKTCSQTTQTLFYLLAIFCGLTTLAGTTLLTEAGQMINLPRDWVIEFFRYHMLASIAIGVMLAILCSMQLVCRFAGKWLVIFFLALNLLGLFFINRFVPEHWLRSQHLTAEFTSIEEAGKRLQEDDDVFVIEINNDARAFPREWMILPHIAGDSVGGKDVAMSYCVLSNLPVAFSSQFNNQPTNYKVIAQVHNNLIFTDRNSGDIIQQITGTAEFSNEKIDQYPIQRMPWRSFQALYPEGKVLRYTAPNTLDKITNKLFERELAKHYKGKPIFPTLDLTDDRLPNSELIWGLDVNGEQLAISASFFKENNIVNIELGGQKISLAWFPKYETLGVFKRQENISLSDVMKIDPYGNTKKGRLERVHTYPGVFWMVWSHWFPNTKVLK